MNHPVKSDHVHIFNVHVPHDGSPSYGKCGICGKIADDLTYPISFGAPSIPAKPIPQTWECFKDESYFDFWCVRPVGEKRFGVGFHVNNGNEAELLKRTLNRCKATCDFKTEQGE